MNNQPNDPLLMDHDVDGIQELDNLLPRWWVWLFYLTIIFGVIYMVYYHVLHVGDLQIAEYEKEHRIGETIKAASIAKFEGSIASLAPSKDPALLGTGQRILSACELRLNASSWRRSTMLTIIASSNKPMPGMDSGIRSVARWK